MAGPPRRQYSDREKSAALAALDACGGSYDKAAAQTGIPKSNIVYWSKGRGVHPEATGGELRESERAALDHRLEELAHRILDRALMDAEGCTLEKANFAQLLTGFGIAVDKMRLLRDQATSITANMSDDERRSRIAGLITAAANRAGAGEPDTERAAGIGSTPLN